jgi:uncharacterized protein YfbU (UPF0304 family)
MIKRFSALAIMLIAFIGCASMQADIPTHKAIEYDVLKAYVSSEKTYQLYQKEMTEEQQATAEKALDKVYDLLQTYRALKDGATSKDTMELIRAKDNMIDILAEMTGG